MSLKNKIQLYRAFFIAICSLICASLGGCELTEEAAGASDPVSLRSGRLRFADLQAFVNTMDELSRIPPDNLGSDHFEARYPGFRALGSTERDLPEMAMTMRVVLNQEGAYQIGDRITLLLGDSEYIVPESEEGLVAALARGTSPDPFVNAGVIERRRVERTTLDVISRGEIPSSQGLLNAKYQSSFSTGGHTFKFVHEAYVDGYSHYLMACFRAKFEYKDGSSWKTAGERVYKEITNAFVEYERTPVVSVVSTSPVSGVRNDSSHLMLCVQVTPPVGNCASQPKLYAESYYSEGTATNILGRVYTHAAAWTTEFTGLRACN